ncbi:MAG: hypothetical protein ABI977_34770 [Acidobacteriota bacterium]
MSNEQFFSRENIAFVIRMLEQSAQPLPVAKLAKAIQKSVPVPGKDLPELLKQLLKPLVETGEIRSGKVRRSDVYWLPSLEDQASERILEPLHEAPLTQTDLKNKLPSLLLGWPKSKREEMLARLIKEKRVYRVASLAGNAKLLSIRAELTPRDYVRLALQLAVVKLKPKLNSEQVYALAQEFLQSVSTGQAEPTLLTSTLAPSNLAVSNVVTPNPEQIILERMASIEPAAATGALVSLSELRRAVAAEIPEKTSFDQAVRRLAEQGFVVLARHDYPAGLSPQERDESVSDEQGNYFIGISKI